MKIEKDYAYFFVMVFRYGLSDAMNFVTGIVGPLSCFFEQFDARRDVN